MSTIKENNNTAIKEYLKDQFTFDTRQIAAMGLLVALEIILSRFCSISLWNLKIGFAFIPVVMAGMLMGPVKGGLVGAVADFLGAVLFPIGAYFPGFTFTAFLKGMVYGALLYRNHKFSNVTIAVLLDQLVLSLLLNSVWISMLYGSPYMPLLYTRIIQIAVLIPIEFVVVYYLPKLVVNRLKPMIKDPKKTKTKTKAYMN